MLVSVGCLVSKEMLDLVVSTVVMVVTVREEQQVLKASLVQRVPQVSKVLLAHAENVVKMVMMVQRVPREPKALQVKTVPQVLVGNVVFQEQTVQKEQLVLKALQVSVDCLVLKLSLIHI